MGGFRRSVSFRRGGGVVDLMFGCKEVGTFWMFWIIGVLDVYGLFSYPTHLAEWGGSRVSVALLDFQGRVAVFYGARRFGGCRVFCQCMCFVWLGRVLVTGYIRSHAL